MNISPSSRVSLRPKVHPAVIIRQATDKFGNPYPGFRIQSNGHVLRDDGTTVKPSISDGYHSVSLPRASHAGTGHEGLNRLVGRTFCLNDDPANKIECDHIDDNRGNNDCQNIQWMTKSDNIKKSYATGAKKPVVRKLSRAQAEEIRRLVSTGRMTDQAIADQFGVSRQTVNNITAYDSHYGKTKLKRGDIIVIHALSAMGWSNAEIAQWYDCGRRKVRNALLGKTHPDAQTAWTMILRTLATGDHRPLWDCDKDIVLDGRIWREFMRRPIVPVRAV
jgi:predicted DNA-binding protein (UPF0251 family)